MDRPDHEEEEAPHLPLAADTETVTVTITEIIGTTGGTAGTALTMGPGSMIAMVGAGMMTITTGMTATGTAMETDMGTTTTPSIQTTEPAAGAQLLSLIHI